MKKIVNKTQANVLLQVMDEKTFESLYEIKSYSDKVIDTIEPNDEKSFKIFTFKEENSFNPNKKLNAIFSTFFGKWCDEKGCWIIPNKYKDEVVKMIKAHGVFWKI